ncbi:MAG: YbjQ family protein [Synergistaceae bacterium]|jgi:uncharacterized protein YbjQ (UPF0145 family)|nr:YbjQ family protein [Synergistaceae bacterium]
MRTEETAKIAILTIDVEADCSVRLLGTVYGVVCLSKSLTKDLAANVRNWTIGGELPAYSAMMSEGVGIVLERIKEQAQAVGADAVYGLRLSTTSITQGAAELIAYGTAVKYLE